jgi:L-2,4-diaminobutyric acid acetyltransferase
MNILPSDKKKYFDQNTSLVFRVPQTEDGKYLYELAVQSQTLDVNSCYHYLLLCRHFFKTSCVAELDGRVVGFVTGYIPPEEPATLFIWQVTVHDDFRGQGVALTMLDHLVRSLSGHKLDLLKTTITPDNRASINLFTALSERIGAPHRFNDIFFSEEQFGKAGHDKEMLFQIGPALHS